MVLSRLGIDEIDIVLQVLFENSVEAIPFGYILLQQANSILHLPLLLQTGLLAK
jgi:hypothetical protein